MALLQLPRVLFEQIIETVVEDERCHHLDRILGYRLVCRVFDDFVLDRMVRHAAQNKLKNPKCRASDQTFRHPALNAAALQRKIALGNDKHPIVKDITALVDALLEREWLSDPDGRVAAEIRTRYTKNLCDAFRALDYMGLYRNLHRWGSGRSALDTCLVAVSAAIGDVQMLPNIAHSLEDILGADEVPHGLLSIISRRIPNVLNAAEAADLAANMNGGDKVRRFPNALDAAVAANQIKTVDAILKWLLDTVRGPWESTKGTWDEMRYVSRAIMDALIIAVRLGRNTVGKLIMEIFIERDVLADSVCHFQVEHLYKECVTYGNDAFFSVALQWKKHHAIPDLTDPSLSELLCAGDLPYVVRRGLPCLLRALIRSGKIDPNSITYFDSSRPKVETPLWIALTARRYKMAAVLLEEGADINGVAPGQTYSAYWRAYQAGYGDDQWFLIYNGADTKRENGQGGQPQIRTKYGNYHAFGKWEPCEELGRLYPEAKRGETKK